MDARMLGLRNSYALDTSALLAMTTMTSTGCLPCQQRREDAARLAAAVVAKSNKRDGQPYDVALGDTQTAPTWSGVIGVEGEMTGDGRLIEANALRWENLPLPLRYVASDSGEHDGAVVVGTIDSISRGANGAIIGTGTFDSNSADGIEAMRQVSSGLTTGISMDLDDVSFEIRVAQEVMDEDGGFFPMLLASDPTAEPAPPTDSEGRVIVAKMNADDEVRVTTDGRIRAATIVAIPAFASAQIHMADMMPPPAGKPSPTTGKLPDGTDCSCDEADPAYDPNCDCTKASAPPNAPNAKPGAPGKKAAVVADPGEGSPAEEASDGLMPDGTTACSCDEAQPDYDPNCDCTKAAPAKKAAPPFPPAKKAAAVVVAGAAPLSPPAAWFSRPAFNGPHPLSVTADGRVYGHLAEWNTCHISHTAQGQCVTAPHSASANAYFHTGSIMTAEGAEIPVGHITLDTRHAGERLSPAATASHYEDTGTVVADVASGEDEWGIWVAGSLRPTVTDTQVRALRSSPLSGDWRRIGNNLELVAALAVNVPGFPIPRPSGLVAGGVVRSLVASGMIAPRTVMRPGTPGSLSMDDLRYLKRLADRERAEESALRAGGSLPSATDLARRVRASSLAVRARKGVHHGM